MYRHPDVTSAERRCPSGRAAGRGSGVRMRRMPSAEPRKLSASIPIAAVTLSHDTSRPPSGGPALLVTQNAVSNRAFAATRCSAGTSDFRFAPLAALKAMPAVVCTIPTTQSCGYVRRPVVAAAGTLASATNRTRSAPIMTGRL